MRGRPAGSVASRDRSYFIETLGCPKNVVDSDKLAGRLADAGYRRAARPEEADLVVVNTCAFIEPAREESIETILDLAGRRRPGARLTVTGCLAERSGPELAAALPEIDLVAGFGVELTGETAPVTLTRRKRVDSFDLLELPRPPAEAPWAYVKAAEGCDRRCGFCAIPSFRGRQRSRPIDSILEEVERLSVREVVLVAQDLASYGRDLSGETRSGGILELVAEVSARVPWVRLLYLYPSSLSDRLIEAIVATGVAYFDLSLQHVSGSHLRRMRRWGNGVRFLETIGRIRSAAPEASLRSSFIVGYPGESEEDHDALLAFLEEAQLDWAGFFRFSREPGTYADGLDEDTFVPESLLLERLAECEELQDSITRRRRQSLVGRETTVLLETPRRGRSHREAPEIDGVVRLANESGEAGDFLRVRITEADGVDLVAEVIE